MLAGLLASGQVTNNGIHVQDFERKLAHYLGVKETVAVSTGSDALLLALKALALARGKAILPAYTYIATLNAVVHAGLDPVFCDIDSRTFTMDPAHLAQIIDNHKDVRCVIPVNVFGVPADLPAIRKLCDGAKATLFYDNAHGFGTEVNDRKIAREADAQVFSFHATKTLPAVEGGLVVSDNPRVLSAVKQLRNHGLAPNINETIPGFNAKMDEIRAVIGIQSLEDFPATVERRRYYGHRLLASFNRFPDVFTVQVIPEQVKTNFQNLGVRCSYAARIGLPRIMELFRSMGVGVRSYFDPPLYKFKGFDTGPALPVTESVWQTLISFPIHSRMTEAALVQIEQSIAQVAELAQCEA
ncbi:MAG: DegT/DnrJ/EryC1/StrS family aminotransferase [Terriglobia bacterium]|nr:DegT/DnrJ/EryC1/StrS family aminotransferase [Terriglobia bacterium]